MQYYNSVRVLSIHAYWIYAVLVYHGTGRGCGTGWGCGNTPTTLPLENNSGGTVVNLGGTVVGLNTTANMRVNVNSSLNAAMKIPLCPSCDNKQEREHQVQHIGSCLTKL